MGDPSNKELRAEIKKLSEQLGVEVTLASSRPGLLEQLEVLRGAAARRGQPSEPDTGDASADTSDETPAPAEATGDGPSTEPAAASAADSPPPEAPPEPNDELKAPVGLSDDVERELAELEASNEHAAHRLRTVLGSSEVRGLDDGRDLSRVLLRSDPVELAELTGTAAFVRTLSRHLAGAGFPAIASVLGVRAEALEAALARASGYAVAPGRSLTTTRGLLGPGERVPNDIPHERLERLVEKGVLVRV